MLKIAAAGIVCAGLLERCLPRQCPMPSCCTCASRCATTSGWTPTCFIRAGSGRFPTVLIRTPYGKGADLPSGYQSFINHGYAVVMQDVRGRYGSAGVFNVLNQEGPDGYDTLNWIAAQPWSDGQVGMIGGSYLGIAQWRVALLNNPHLKAIFPVVSGSDDYFDRYYSPGGAMKLGHRLLWMSQNLTAPGTAKPKFRDYIYHLPLRTVDRSATRRTLGFYQTILNHPTYDSFWKEAERSREHRARARSRVFGRRLVRQLRRKRSGSLLRLAQAAWPAGRPAPHHDRPVGAQHVDAVSGRELMATTRRRPFAAIRSNGSIIG